MEAGYKDKLKKYRGHLEKDIIPIVMSPRFEMHIESIKHLAKITNISATFSELAV